MAPLALVRIFPPCVTTSKETSIPCQPPCHPPCLSPLSSSPYYGITNRQSYISKVLSRYLHSPGSHQLTWFLELLTHSVTHVASIASHDAKNESSIIKLTFLSLFPEQSSMQVSSVVWLLRLSCSSQLCLCLTRTPGCIK